MNDPVDDRIANSLRACAPLAPDPIAAHREFLNRRRRRYQRLAAASAAALVTVAGVALAAARSGEHSSKLTAAGQNPPPSAASSISTSTTSAAPVATPTTANGRVAVAPKPRTTAAPQPTASTTTAAPNLNNDVVQMTVVTEADDGKTFTLHRGNSGILVKLSNNDVWTEPQSSDAHVLPRTSGSTNGDGSAQATFMATGDGQAVVSADGRSHPLPCQTAQPPCMVPDHIVHFQVTVNVVG